MKKLSAALGAALAVTFAPSKAMAAAAVAPEPTAQAQEDQHMQTPQPMILPSQVAHAKRIANGGQSPVVTLAKKVATDKRLYMVIGAGAAGAAGFQAYKSMEQKKNDSIRNLLANSNVKIDASILDEARVNRPGAKKFQYTGDAAKFGTYREPPKKLMKDVRDKYKFQNTGKDAEKDSLDDLAAFANLDIFKKDRSGDVPDTNGDTIKKVSDLDVEVVGDDDAGPKTAEQKALEEELGSLNIEGMADFMNGMGGGPDMDPAMMAAALPALQEQLAELMKGGISKEEVKEVKKSFTDMGIDLDDMFDKIDQMEKAGLSDAVGPDGAQFFKTLRQIINSA